MIRDRLVYGTNSRKVHERFINRGADLDLNYKVRYSWQRPGVCGPHMPGKTTAFKVDTGAQVNILHKAEFDKLRTRQTRKHSKVTLRGYGGHTLSNLGVCELECCYKDVIHNLHFDVVDVHAPPILEHKSSVDMKLVKTTVGPPLTPALSSTMMMQGRTSSALRLLFQTCSTSMARNTYR